MTAHNVVKDLAEALRSALDADRGGRVRTGALDVHAYAHDASHFLLLPAAVVMASDADDVSRTLAVASERGAAVTFRSGGTSLSGQGVSDGILVDVRRGFRGIEILDDGARVRVQPGAVVRQVNVRLARYGRKLGPDPASEIACTLGGVIANNSSGMSCGTEQNTYRTLESMRYVLPSGTVVDSAAPDADEALRAAEPHLHATLGELRDRVRADPELAAEIRRQFSMKNTMGYAINALVDFDRPVDILTHLIVGSEGTLAFVAEAVLRTVPLARHVATGLLVFPGLEQATAAIPDLVASGAVAIELMDALSLRVAATDPQAHPLIRTLDVDEHAALLIEYAGEDEAQLGAFVAAAEARIPGLALSESIPLTSDGPTRAALWHIRKGLYAAVAGARPQGTTALLEDVVVPVEQLAATCRELAALFERFGYTNCVVFGHAKDGNIHFMLTDRFHEDEPRERFARFTDELVELILARGGSLKAEHGTGRVMAPYVERQYGAELYEVMRSIKRACDPAGILNPGVLISDDPQAHLRNLKSAPAIEPEADRCVECGYCEPVCPSRDLTTTPRQRIVLRRDRAAAEAAGDMALVRELDRAYEYAGLDTCAVDGMCVTACPVGINTGDLVKRLREPRTNAVERAVWNTTAKHWKGTTSAISGVLTVASKLPAPVVQIPNKAARAVLGHDTVPLWTPDLPAGGRSRRRPDPGDAAPEAVFLPSCLGTMFAPSGEGVQSAFERLCAEAGITVEIPQEIDSLCCGTPWSSKGYPAGRDAMAERVVEAVRVATEDGRLPVVCDASSCTEGYVRTLREAEFAHPLRVVDAVDFVAEQVLPALGDLERLPSLSVHPTCSSVHLGSTGGLLAIANAIAETVHVPDDWGCCGFAGDRGMLHPELTASATRLEAEEVRRVGAAAHASSNRACELGMSRATGEDYRGILELLAERLP